MLCKSVLPFTMRCMSLISVVGCVINIGPCFTTLGLLLCLIGLEFYCNMHEVTKNSFKTFVRGNLFCITPELLSVLLEIPCTEGANYPNIDNHLVSFNKWKRSWQKNLLIGRKVPSIKTNSLIHIGCRISFFGTISIQKVTNLASPKKMVISSIA